MAESNGFSVWADWYDLSEPLRLGQRVILSRQAVAERRGSRLTTSGLRAEISAPWTPMSSRFAANSIRKRTAAFLDFSPTPPRTGGDGV